jgi:hypothetical protein
MTKLVLVLLFLFVSNPMFSQTLMQEPIFRDGKMNDPAELIQRNYRPDKQELYKLCLNSVAFVKFSIGEQGDVENITVTKGTPSAIANALKEAVTATNGYWTPKLVDGKPVPSDPFIMPLVYFYDLNCNSELEHVKGNQLGQSMRNMLLFENEEVVSTLKCTLLPAFVTAIRN